MYLFFFDVVTLQRTHFIKYGRGNKVMVEQVIAPKKKSSKGRRIQTFTYYSFTFKPVCVCTDNGIHSLT